MPSPAQGYRAGISARFPVRLRDVCRTVADVGVLVGLIGFSFVSSVTPGPNNIMLWASGATFGFRRTVRHVVGTALGIGGMALAVAAGIGTLVVAFPQLAPAMKVAGSAYLLYLARQIAGSGGLDKVVVARPLGLIGGAAFQLVNPKAWIFALGAVTTFRPPDLPVLPGTILVAVTMMLVILPSASLWAAAGGIVAGWIRGERSRRVVSGILAALVVATVALVWL